MFAESKIGDLKVCSVGKKLFVKMTLRWEGTRYYSERQENRKCEVFYRVIGN